MENVFAIATFISLAILEQFLFVGENINKGGKKGKG